MVIGEDGTTIELVSRGTLLLAVASHGPYKFEEPLPNGFLTWSEDEIKAHFRRFVTPVLKHKIHQAQELAKEAKTYVAEADKDAERQAFKIIKAEKKRERKVLRLVE